MSIEHKRKKEIEFSLSVFLLIACLHNEEALSECHLESWVGTLGSSTHKDSFILLAEYHSTKHTAVVRNCCKAVSGLPHDACADVQSAVEY